MAVDLVLANPSRRSFKAQAQHDAEKRERDRVRERVRASEASTRGVRAKATTTCDAAKDTCAEARARYLASRKDRDAVRELAREYRLIRRAELARASATKRSRRGPGITRVQESDDAVKQEIPAELRGLWERVKGGIRGSARRSRAEAFLEYVEQHPDEVFAATEIPDDDEYARQAEAHYRRTASNPGPLVALGTVERLETKAGRPVRVPRGTILAYHQGRKSGGLVLVYGARPTRGMSAAAQAEYERTHWGERGRGRLVAGDAPEVPQRARGVELARVVYTTKKGGDAALTDYDHAFEKTLPILVKCDERRVQIHGGSYRVTERGIVG